MKRTLKTMLFTLLLMISMISCNKEELFVEPVVEVVEDDTPDPEDADPVDETDATLPCDFTLDNIEPNATIIINCILDLGGQTVNLPANVTIDYEGGDIINGTLNFGDNGVIDGNLLNSTLTLGGTNPQVKDPTFNFDPKRWGIVEGETTSEIAQRNNNILEESMLMVKDLGVTTFKIDKMDAYFETSKVTSTTTNQNFYMTEEAINVPSDFELIMTDNTILRVFPTVGFGVSTLLAVHDVSNVTIRGGVLYGDRDLRTYSKPFQENGAHLLGVKSGKNIVLDGITLKMGSVGGLNINSLGHTFNPDYIPTDGVVVKNCIFDKIRRIACVITDGKNITVENNEFYDAGQPTINSDGGVVRWAMNIEPVRKRVNGELLEYQKVHDVIVRNNKERGSANGGFLVFAGEHVTFENNDMESQITFSLGSNIKVLNNTFNASEETKGKPAIGGSAIDQVVFDNLISGNIINGYNVGINANYKDAEVANNTINDCLTAFQFKKSINVNIHDNKITSTVNRSYGFRAHLASLNNVNIYNNEVSVALVNFGFTFVNQAEGQENNKFSVYDNVSPNSGSLAGLEGANGVTFKDNIINGSLWITDTKNLEVSGNQINTPNNHGLLIKGENIKLNVQNNIIKYPTTGSLECIKIDSTNNLNEITLTNNSCN